MLGINVEQKHIDMAIAANFINVSKTCPIAQAIKDQFKGKDTVVGSNSFFIFDDENYYLINNGELIPEKDVVRNTLPDIARDFIYAFDRRKPVAPFSF